MSCNVPAADFFRYYVISNLVFEILFSTCAKSKRLTDMPMATTSPRLNTQGLSVVVRNFCRGPSSSDTSFRLHGRAVVAGGSRGTASGERSMVAGGSRDTASGDGVGDVTTACEQCVFISVQCLDSVRIQTVMLSD